jgi:hypothetical protein
MPTKTKMLDYGGFVHSPDTPMSTEFADYLRQIDPLLARWHELANGQRDSRFSAELMERRKTAQRELDEFAARYRDRYTIGHVERNPMLLPVARFFAGWPIRRPFSILHCSLDLPLHTVYAFEDSRDLACINAALGQKTPLRWWQNGSSDHPCYLFGPWVWELKPTELNSSEQGLTLLFEKTAESDQRQRNRLHQGLADSSGQPDRNYVSETVRKSVWRRDGGKCARCGSRDGLDFSVVAATLRGPTATAQDVQMLCTRCREQG